MASSEFRHALPTHYTSSRKGANRQLRSAPSWPHRSASIALTTRPIPSRKSSSGAIRLATR